MEHTQAEYLKHCAALLAHYINVLEEKEIDDTGCGIRIIFIDSLERALNVVIREKPQ